MRRQYAEIQQAGADVLGICFDSLDRARSYVAATRSPFPFGVDPARDVYAAYGLGRGSLRQLLHPGGLVRTARIAVTDPSTAMGSRYAAQSDYRQLGGDFVVGPAGVLIYGHASIRPSDYLAIDQLRAILEAGRQAEQS